MRDLDFGTGVVIGVSGLGFYCVIGPYRETPSFFLRTSETRIPYQKFPSSRTPKVCVTIASGPLFCLLLGFR